MVCFFKKILNFLNFFRYKVYVIFSSDLRPLYYMLNYGTEFNTIYTATYLPPKQ